MSRGDAIRVILGTSVESLERLRYPLLASPKLDGIRAFKYGPELFSRTFKCIPNSFVRAALREVPSGWDGELIAGDPTAPDVYRRTNSLVMAESRPIENLRWFVFDNREDVGGFADRHSRLHDLPPLVVKLDHTIVESPDAALAFEERAVAQGYEGIILRSPTGAYKPGRSTLREQYLLKVKRFLDAEARVIGFEELLHNANEATLDERGYTKRSSHQENKIPMGVLGALVCELDGVEFRIGTGFTQADRIIIWRNRDKYLGALAKFKYLPTGIKVAPRHPVWLGWRETIDL